MGKLKLGIPHKLIRPLAVRHRYQGAEKFVSLMAPIDGTTLLMWEDQGWRLRRWLITLRK